MTDDRDLLLRAHRGHEASARLLWDRHAPALHALARAILGSSGVIGAEDVVQATFCRILEVDRRALREVRDVRAWLSQCARRIAHNEVRSMSRERARRGTRPTSAASAVVDDELAAVIRGLPDQMREVIVLKHACGLTFDQIADVLEVNRNTAASRYRAAIRHIRDTLSRQAPEAKDVQEVTSARAD